MSIFLFYVEQPGRNKATIYRYNWNWIPINRYPNELFWMGCYLAQYLSHHFSETALGKVVSVWLNDVSVFG